MANHSPHPAYTVPTSKPSLDSKEKKQTTRSVQRHGWACHKSDDDQDQIGPPQPFVDLYHFNQKKIRKNLAWPGSKGTPIPQFTIIWDLSIYLPFLPYPTYLCVCTLIHSCIAWCLWCIPQISSQPVAQVTRHVDLVGPVQATERAASEQLLPVIARGSSVPCLQP